MFIDKWISRCDVRFLGLRASPAYQKIAFGLNSQVVNSVSLLGLIPSADIVATEGSHHGF